jgi:hypothetical protein
VVATFQGEEPGREDKEDMARLFKEIVWIYITLFDTLSSKALTKLLAVSSAEIEGPLGVIHSVLDVLQGETFPIQLCHLPRGEELIAAFNDRMSQITMYPTNPMPMVTSPLAYLMRTCRRNLSHEKWWLQMFWVWCHSPLCKVCKTPIVD